MIFITTVFLWCAYYLHASAKILDSEDAKKRPWAYDHTSAMGMGFGFFINLILAVIIGIVLEVMIDLPLDIAFISFISLIAVWFLFRYITQSDFKKQPTSSELSRVEHNAFQGKEIDLDDYLASNKYIERNLAYFWKVKRLDTETSTYQDSEGNYWSVSNDVITLCDDKGLPIALSAHWIDDDVEYVIAFHYCLTFGNTLEDLLDIFSIERIDGDDCDIDTDDLKTLITTNELFSIQDDLGNSYDELPFNDREINVFKHGHQLLDRRCLTDKCLFKAYALEYLDAAPSIEGTQNYFNEDPLSVYSGPYHWWSTDKVPAKKGSKAFEDNDGNVFYVSRKKNIGVCHIRNGIPVEDKHVEIRVFWDGGYFMYEFT